MKKVIKKKNGFQCNKCKFCSYDAGILAVHKRLAH
jgi:hypothetical protein